MPPSGRGLVDPSFVLVRLWPGGSAPLPWGFPRVNPFAPNALPLLFNHEEDKHRIKRVVISTTDLGLEDLKA